MIMPQDGFEEWSIYVGEALEELDRRGKVANVPMSPHHTDQDPAHRRAQIKMRELLL